MPRDRDYEEEYHRRNEIAWELGYENAYERQRILHADSPEELKHYLEPRLQQLAAEGDTQSMGLIYRDLYESWDMPGGFELGDVWDDIGISDVLARG
jgi:hypothetical protein